MSVWIGYDVRLFRLDEFDDTDFHITLAYLGAAPYTRSDETALLNVVRDWFFTLPRKQIVVPIGVEYFGPINDRVQAVTLEAESPFFERRDKLVGMIELDTIFRVDRTWDFTPHITLGEAASSIMYEVPRKISIEGVAVHLKDSYVIRFGWDKE